MNDRYSRHISLKDLGEEGQAKLSKTSVFVLGIGGIGSPAAQYLASSGVGKLVINDFDLIDKSNLSRQILFHENDIGKPKVEVAKKRINEINDNIEVEIINKKLNLEEYLKIVSVISFILDCSDNFETRFAISKAAFLNKIPIIHGAAIRFEGQILVFLNDGNGPCYSCIYNSEDEWLGDCQGNGVLSTVPGVIGVMMATELLKLACGLGSELSNCILAWDAKKNNWKKVNIDTNTSCETCSSI